MRARRVDNGSELRLFQDEREVGLVDGSGVSFRGFETSDDAILAATVAQRALARRRRSQQADTVEDATLLPPTPEVSGIDGWGFKIALLPSEQVEVFAVARARVIWRALQGTGVSRRMRQFADGLASV